MSELEQRIKALMGIGASVNKWRVMDCLDRAIKFITDGSELNKRLALKDIERAKQLILKYNLSPTKE